MSINPSSNKRASPDEGPDLPPDDSSQDTESVAARSSVSQSPISVRGYEIVRELHRGGQGIVYEAIQQSTKRKVAIKVLLEGPRESEESRKRFEREIGLIAHFNHPNIVKVFDSGVTAQGDLYCVLEYIHGISLTQHVTDNRLTLNAVLPQVPQPLEYIFFFGRADVAERS